ncbi:MAG: methyltransferase type 12 [Pseudonocardiales bacterium]|nr:methyltransferase type 12 [Pseudonocardiales bacterium]
MTHANHHHHASQPGHGSRLDHGVDLEGVDLEEMFTPQFWDDRYSSADSIWSGNPNPHLVDQIADLTPGTALDVGSGEGADSIWLAEQGWQVTGADISRVALNKSAARAEAAGVGDRITWLQADFLTWDPAPLQFDLVSAQFMHLPLPAVVALHRRLAASVRPGGTLLIVSHHPMDMEAGIGHQRPLDLFITAEEVAEKLDQADWQIDVVGAPAREMIDADGNAVTLHDALLRATRR